MNRVVTARLLSRCQPSKNLVVRALSSSRIVMAASNFGMPAMSPTMTEGGIISWNYKEGDSFSAGDVLLEVETDKAQIDVEAQDDGIIAKIYYNAGEKGIPVGKTIAVLAEPGDDIKSVEIPKPDEGNSGAAPAAAASPPPPAAAEAGSSSATTATSSTSDSTATSTSPANPKQVLSPSVLSLAVDHGISSEEAIAKIPASGPNGRILKGDALAYFGSVARSDVDTLNETIKNLQHLDLSNIHVKAPTPPAASASKSSGKPATSSSSSASASPAAPAVPVPSKPAAPAPEVLEGLFSLADIASLQELASSSLSASLSTQKLVDKASKLALKDVTLLSKPKKSVLIDPVFEQLIGPAGHPKPFEVSIKYPVKPKKLLSSKKTDIFDVLSASKKTAQIDTSELLTVSVTINSKALNGRDKAKIYLDRLGYYLRDGKGDLIL